MQKCHFFKHKKRSLLMIITLIISLKHNRAIYKIFPLHRVFGLVNFSFQMLSSFFPITVNLSHIGRPRVVDLGDNCQRTNCQFRCWAELLRIVPVSRLRISLEAAKIVFVPQLYFADLLSFSLMRLSNTQGGWSVNSIHHTNKKSIIPQLLIGILWFFFYRKP